MGIQSLGVGSGLALDDLVTQLIEAERAPKEERLNEREETLDATISAIGSLKSKVDEFQDAVEELKNDYNLNAREPQIDHPTEPEEGKTGPFTVEASTSALEADYEIAVKQLATGSTHTSADSIFTSTSDTVVTTDTTVTFGFELSTTKSFSIDFTASMSLSDYVNAINNSADNIQDDGTTPLVTAILLDTGNVGPKVIYKSQITGDGDHLVVDGGGNSELQALATTNAGGAETLTRTKDAKNAIAYIDNIQVESSTNEFENVIPNVSFEVHEVSEAGTDVDGLASSKLTIGNDKDGLKSKIQDFIDSYNSLIDEIKRLTRYGESELEDDGALAGDFMVRGLQNGIANVLTTSVSGNSLGSIFNFGLSFDNDGKLEISAVDEFGIGSGDERLDDALEDNFDEVADVFTNSTNGVAKSLYDFLYEYTTFGGLLRDRESELKDEKDLLADEREAFELRMLSFEQIQRNKYIALDKTVSSLNNTGNALFAALGGI